MKLEEMANEEGSMVFHVLVEGHEPEQEPFEDDQEVQPDGDEVNEIPEEENLEEDMPMFVESRCKGGSKILQYNGHRYRKVYKCKRGYRYVCSSSKNCGAYVYINEENEITTTNEVHAHKAPTKYVSDNELNDTAVVITSRKGKEMLLFRQFTYRKQYDKGNKCRWVCSNLKNCRACVFTDENNCIISAFEEHIHDPPKYYLKPDHLLGALREPLILETE